MSATFRRVLTLIAALCLALAAGMTAAHAVTDFSNAPQGAHYASGSGEPVCTFVGSTLSCTGTQIVGVGNTNADLEIAVTTSVTGVCRNPGVNNKVVDPFTESDTAETSIELTPSKNGRLIVPAQSVPVPSPSDVLADFSCPNPNWTPVVTSTAVSFTYTLTFDGFQDPVIALP